MQGIVQIQVILTLIQPQPLLFHKKVHLSFSKLNFICITYVTKKNDLISSNDALIINELTKSDDHGLHYCEVRSYSDDGDTKLQQIEKKQVKESEQTTGDDYEK